MNRRRCLCLSFCVALVPAWLAAEPHSLGHSFENVERYVKMFESPDRAGWQMPDKVVDMLFLRPGDRVADIGAGSGYFARRLARAVGDQGVVYAVDIVKGMLDYIDQRAKKERQANIRTVLATADDPKLQPRSTDLVFICDTLHHIGQRPDYYRKLRCVLKPGGRIAIVDFYKKKTPGGGPPVEHRLAKQQVIEELTSAGFRLIRDFNFLPRQYYLIFQAPAASQGPACCGACCNR